MLPKSNSTQNSNIGISLPNLEKLSTFFWCSYLRILFMNLGEFKAANLFVVWRNYFGILHQHLVDFKVTEYAWDPNSYFRYFATIFCWTQSCHQNDNIFFRLIRYSSYYHISSPHQQTNPIRTIVRHKQWGINKNVWK